LFRETYFVTIIYILEVIDSSNCKNFWGKIETCEHVCPHTFIRYFFAPNWLGSHVLRKKEKNLWEDEIFLLLLLKTSQNNIQIFWLIVQFHCLKSFSLTFFQFSFLKSRAFSFNLELKNWISFNEKYLKVKKQWKEGVTGFD